MPSKLLGLDVGTGGTRAVLVDSEGTVVASQTADHAPFTSPQTGWAEQQPADWWRATCDAVKQVLAASDTKPSEIAAVGFSGQMHGAVLLDAAGEVLRPALIWCDQRTADEAPRVDRANRRRPDHRLDLQSCPHQLHSDQVVMGAEARAEPLRAFSNVALAQGLRPLPSYRRLWNGHGRRIRHAAARRRQSSLVDRDGSRHRP